MSIMLVVGSKFINEVCIYASQIGLEEDVKWLFWEELDEVI